MRVSSALFAASLCTLFAVGCGSAGADPAENAADIEQGAEVDETADELASTSFWFATPETASCPGASRFDGASGFCVESGRAVGPFSAAMVSACQAGSGVDCDSANWPVAQASRFRGSETCPVGTSIDQDLGVCSDAQYVYGPVDVAMVERCVALGGGGTCAAMRFEKKFVAPLPDEDAAIRLGTRGVAVLGSECDGLNAKMYAYYTTRAGYSAVSRAGFKTLGTRKNGCATWLSHAIRQSGGDVPVNTGTEGFRDALKSRGWTVIRNREDLQPGDVIVTKDRKGRPGHPDHVYMFAGWQGALPLAVDNQGFTHVRTAGKSPIAYGLRAPTSNSAACQPTPPSSDAGAAAPDNCAGKADGWYCSELQTYSSYECKGESIQGGWQCASSSQCRKGSDGRATMSGAHPGCF
jgi:hypothetical protein